MANLAQTVNHLLKIIKNHIGRGGNSAHLPVDIDFSGFMTPEMLKRLNATSGQLTPTKTDNFFELSAGTYCVDGTATNNAPIPSGFYITQVFEFLDRKLIYSMHMHTGVLYVYGFNRVDGSDETPMSKRGWRTIDQHVVLWEGTASTPGTMIDLGDDLTRYRRIRIYYNINPTLSNSSVEISTSTIMRAETRFNGINLANNPSSLGIGISEIAVSATKNPRIIEIIQQKTVYADGNGRQSLVDDQIEIFRIIGVK